MVIKEVQEEVNWVDYMDVEAMKTMLKMEGDVFAITNEEPSDPSTFIVPTVGQLNNCTWVGFSKNVRKKVCNACPNVLFNIFNKMSCDLSYFDVSHIIEILHLNNSNDFENEINKKLEKALCIYERSLFSTRSYHCGKNLDIYEIVVNKSSNLS